MDPKSSSATRTGREFGWMLLLLAVVVTLLLGATFQPDHTLFSNDGPLARLVSQCHRLPDAFFGVWEDLNTIGYREHGALPDITYGLLLALKPILFSKFYVPIALIILGLGAWCFFRQSGLARPACILGGLAAVLNSDFFSTACWGVAGHPLAVGMTFFAMAALVKTSSWRGWARAALAGFAVGMGVAEGADVGAIFSMFVAIFVIYQAWITEGPRVKNLAIGAGRLALVVVFAAFLAAQAISAMINTQIEGVHGMQQDTQTHEDRWGWATQWSLPKGELLSLVVPGLYGYRLDTPGGGNYWGAIGRDLKWQAYIENGQQGTKPTGLIRQTGGGIYTGVTVVVLAIWAAAQSFRKKDSVFNLLQRRWLWFWIVVGFVSLLFGLGHYAPFYRILYALPYFSTIRNPIKFISVLNFALVILFAYGVDGLWRTYLERGKSGPRPAVVHAAFDKRWLYGCLVVFVGSLIGWAIYSTSRTALQEYLTNVQFPETRTGVIADFSIAQVGWFILFFVLVAGLMALILRGTFTGTGATFAMILLGFFLVFDLGRADQPWIIDWNYVEKYASNPVLDVLRERPYESRVALEPFHARPQHALLDELYHYEWAQQHFQYYNIQSLDIVQLPRAPQDLVNYQKATHFDGTEASMPLVLRRWELTNTRYLMGAAEYITAYNKQFDPVKQRFRIAARFKIIQRPGATSPRRLERLTAEFAPDGDYAIFEFTGGLPRAKLYSSWQVNTNSDEVLKELVAPEFDPAQSIFIDGGLPDGVPNVATNQNTGLVEFASYDPKNVVLNAQVASASVLLLNDRYDPNWKVLVDGKPARLLKCNYLMRGVYLEPGNHKVEFHFRPPVGALYISLAAIGVGVLLLGVVLIEKSPEKKASAKSPAPAPRPQPAAAPAPAAAVAPKPAGQSKSKRSPAKSKR